jgi:TolB-like protein
VVRLEELREAVWGSSGTFVDFDQGLNFCVAQIRGALKDSAESPRFVRTVPKRGYQFIAPVAGVAPVVRPNRWRVAWAGVLVVGAAFAMWPPHSQPLNVAVARFDNETGQAELDRFADTLTDSVVAELTEAGKGRFGVIGNAAVLRKPRNERDLLAIGSSLRAGYVVLGQVQNSPAGIRVLAHLIRLPRQTHVSVRRFEGGVEKIVAGEPDTARRIAADFASGMAANK